MGSRRRKRALLAWAVATAIGVAAPIEGARAQFDLFGLFGRAEAPPEPSPDALPYDFELSIEGDADLDDALETISTLYRLRGEPPPDAAALVRRAQADIVPFVDALWASGYYDARVVIEVAGAPLTIRGEGAQAAIAAAAPFRDRARVPVRVLVETGEPFTLRRIRFEDEDGAPLALPDDVVAIEPGARAETQAILAAQARVVDYYRAASRPFATIADVVPVVDHPANAMDLTISVSPGPVAGIGPIAVGGNDGVPEAVVRSFIYAEPGDPYSPEAIAAMRRSIGRIEAISAVRVVEGEALDAFGDLPLEVVIAERLPRVFGVQAAYSTVDGPRATVYWAHRNLFGGAERLRLEGSVFYLTQGGGIVGADREWYEDLGYRVSASFLKPALGGTRNDLLIDALGERDRARGYVADLVNVTAGIRRRFSDQFNVTAGVEYERGSSRDLLGRLDYTLVGLPVSLELDATTSALDPREGYRLRASATPYLEALGSSAGFVQARLDASAYFPFDDRGRYVLAGRVGVGSILGADLLEIPANRRFFAGGGGSVRGYAYRSLSPRIGAVPIGGRSLFEASVEARLRITDTIGLVPFLDAGGAFAESYPTFDEELRYAAGLGVRYHTAIGPLRLDVAVPLNPRTGDQGFGVYIGIGQSF